MDKAKNKISKGGKRKGAGRPALTEDQKKFRALILFDQDVIAVLDGIRGSRSRLIDKALREYYGIKAKNQPNLTAFKR